MKITRFLSNRIVYIAALLLAVVITLVVISTSFVNSVQKPENIQETVPPETAAQTEAAGAKHMIPGAEDKVIVQDVLMAGCETYACTMLFHILGFDIDEITFANTYLDCRYVFEDDDGNMTGPDMYSAFAGTAYAGWGVYAPSMAKSMNKYLHDAKADYKAYDAENIPLDTLCNEYIDQDIPVMIWATTDMEEPFVMHTWKVNYVDENAKTKIGDDFNWYAHEHCLVLIGYDDNEYYFCDSAAGKVSHFKKDLVAKRYEQMGSQSIVVL